MSSHDGRDPYRDASERMLEESAQLIVASTISDLLNEVMASEPGTPEFECTTDRHRVIAWLEHLSEVHWAEVNLIVPSAPDTLPD